MVALSKIGIAQRSQAWKETEPRGLNPTQAQVLVALNSVPTAGMRLSELASRLGVSPPTVSDSVGSLQVKGLLTKQPAPDDARALTILLTDQGRTAAGELSQWPDALLATTHVLSAQEQGVFLRALLKMIRELQETGQVSPSQMCVTCEFFRPNAHDDLDRPHHCEFVGAAFGDRNLRVECPDHSEAVGPQRGHNWDRFVGS